MEVLMHLLSRHKFRYRIAIEVASVSVIVSIAMTFGLVAAKQAPSQPPVRIPPPDITNVVRGVGAVKGKVINQVTGTGIADVVVSLSLGGGETRRVLTGVMGDFSIEGLPSGKYLVELVRDGYLKVRGNSPVTIEVNNGQTPAEIRLQLVPASSISGVVSDENGIPKASVGVLALRRYYQNGHAMLPSRVPSQQRVVTDEQGRFRLYNLEAGEYYVATAGILSQYSPGGIDPLDATPVFLAPGSDLLGINIHYRKTTQHSVKFRIVQPEKMRDSLDQLPYRFQIIRHSQSGTDVTLGIGPDSGDGRGFAFQKVVDGNQWSAFLNPGSYEVFYGGASSGRVGHLEFNIVDRDVDAGTLVVDGPFSLVGQIRIDGASTTSFSANRLGLSLLATDNRDPGFTTGDARVNADRTFAITRIPTGRFNLNIDGLPADFYLSSVRYGGREVRDTGLEIVAATSDSVELTISGLGGSVDGIARDRRGSPVANARVVLIPSADQRNVSTAYKIAVSNEKGSFSLRGIPPGEYDLLGWENVTDGAWMNDDLIKSLGDRALKVRASQGGHQTLDVRIIPNEK
jgi:hypothetical protein